MQAKTFSLAGLNDQRLLAISIRITAQEAHARRLRQHKISSTAIDISRTETNSPFGIVVTAETEQVLLANSFVALPQFDNYDARGTSAASGTAEHVDHSHVAVRLPSHLATGLYWITLRNSHERAVHRLFKQ